MNDRDEERAAVVAYLDRQRVRYIAERDDAVRAGDMSTYAVTNGIVVGIVMVTEDIKSGAHRKETRG